MLRKYKSYGLITYCRFQNPTEPPESVPDPLIHPLPSAVQKKERPAFRRTVPSLNSQVNPSGWKLFTTLLVGLAVLQLDNRSHQNQVFWSRAENEARQSEKERLRFLRVYTSGPWLRLRRPPIYFPIMCQSRRYQGRISASACFFLLGLSSPSATSPSRKPKGSKGL